MVPIAASFSILFAFLLLMLNICDGAKQWSRPADGKARMVKGNDGVQTIVFESPTDGVWEIGNGEIWHKPVGGGPVNKTAEFDPIPTDYIKKKMKELTGGSIRVQGDPAGSIRPTGNKSGGDGGSIRPPPPGAPGSGSIRTQPIGSIRGGSGKKKWTAPTDGQARLVTGNDGVQTIVFESPTDGVWEIGNGEIWHQPVGGGPVNKTAEFKALSSADIAAKKAKLSGGSIRVTEGGSIRQISGSIRPNPPAGSIRDIAGSGSDGGSGSIRDTSSGSIRPTKPIHPMATIVENAKTMDIGDKSYYVFNIDKERGKKHLYSIKDKPVGDKTVRKVEDRVKNLSLDDKKTK